MKMLTGVTAAFAVMALFAGSALAVPSGKTLEYEGGGTGKVVFDGKKHAELGFKCNDCHTNIFQMKRQTTKVTMAEINSGKHCGECHNGTRAFKAGDAANCSKCHKK